MINGWYPEFEPGTTTTRLVCGDSVCTLVDLIIAPGVIRVASSRVLAERAWQSSWLRPNELLYHTGDSSLPVPQRSTWRLPIGGERAGVGPAYSELVAAAGVWAGFLALGLGQLDVYRNDQVQSLPQGCSPALDPDGQLAYTTPYQSNTRQLVVDGVVRHTGGALQLLHRSRRAVVWTQYEGRRPTTWGLRLDRADAVPERLHVSDGQEFAPVAIDLPDGDVAVLRFTDVDLRLAPWAQQDGWIVATGDTRNPHAKLTPHGVACAWSNGRGQLGLALQDLAEPTVHLPALSSVPVTPPPPPPPDPDPPIVAIASYEPAAGTIPLRTRAVAVLSGGPATTLTWLARVPGGQWVTVAANPARDLDHTYRFDSAGAYEIAVRADGPGGHAQTGKTRIVTARPPVVVDPPVDPPDDVVHPAPQRLPRRPRMMVGCCWPLPFEHHPTDTPPNIHLRMLSLLGLTALRVNAHHARPDVLDLLIKIGEAGLRPWPILDVTVPRRFEDAPAVLDAELPGFTRLCHEIGTRLPWITEVEIYNEPSGTWPLGGLRPPDYVRLCIAAGEALRAANPHCRIYIACEHVSTGTGESNPHWLATRDAMPADLYDGVAIHPYRLHANGSHFGSRREEFDRLRAVVPADKPIVCTEVGFNLRDHGGNQEAVVDELWTELEIQRALGIDATFIYAHVGSGISGEEDFGLFTGGAAWQPRAAAFRVAEFTFAHEETR